jgi:ATP-dependent RNA helicase DDX23/PRP28
VEPISLEEMVAKKKAAEEEASKPKFLTKAQRQAEAIKKRQAIADEQRSKLAAQRQARKALTADARDARHDGGHRRDRDVRGSSSGGGSAGKRGQTTADPQELEAIRDRYLGSRNKKRRIRKMNEKKFVFDWDAAEDTSVDYNPLYINVHEAQLFGRGSIAGIDVVKQKRDKSKFYDDILEQRRTREEKMQEERRLEKEREKAKRSIFDNRHWTKKPLEEMVERDWRIMKEDFSISFRGGAVPHPLRNWEEANLKPEIRQILRDLGFKEPSPVQRAAIPIGLQNRDVIGIAQTGSGKTLAFVIPLVTWITSLPKLEREADIDNGPYGVILAPTRELCQQISAETDKFSRPLNIRTVTIVGGVSREEQGMELRRGVEIIIATPGRLVDVLENRYLVLNQCTYLVMDEADRMLDMNFEIDLQKILEFLPVSNTKPDDESAEDPTRLLANMQTKMKFRQTVLFSATMPPAVERIAMEYLRRPATVSIGTKGQANLNVTQEIVFLSEPQKRKKLMAFLQTHPDPPLIIFVNQKKGADMLVKGLEKMGFSATALHGGKSQELREHALASVKNGSKDILVATDVAGRGIDIKAVSYVINYDMAKSVEHYTHRIGRTGRAGATGTAITYLTEEDSETFYELKKFLERNGQDVPKELARHSAALTNNAGLLDKHGKLQKMDWGGTA